MKKLLIGLCFLCASTPSMAAGANKMTMVTYFPVKYVAYSQVDVMKQMDVGLTSACQMNLGCSVDEGFNTGKSLRVNNLLKIAGGKLELNDAPAIEGSTARIGSGNGTADFDFETSLRVGNYKQGYTLQADNMYLNELNLFGYKFPKCEGETMSWQKLKLKNKEEVYLVCGEATAGEDPCANESKKTYWNGTECVCPNTPVQKKEDLTCPGNMKGTQYRTWNDETCSWDYTNNCSEYTWKKVNINIGVTDNSYCPYKIESRTGYPTVRRCQSITSISFSGAKEGDNCAGNYGVICYNDNDCNISGSSGGTGYYLYSPLYKCQ
ncbi:hypothetical protein [Candidatus Avelusimicrobium fimicolum]|uniref:hypothetical protein n=2 Tax=Candidatus Avelusimicrobium fimicolum TaxID=3416216 RepID=UPI003D0F04B6